MQVRTKNGTKVRWEQLFFFLFLIPVTPFQSYPLVFVGTRDGLLDMFKVKERGNALLNNVTYALLAIVTLMASRLTDLGMVASVGGATFGTALVFVYPCIMFLKSQGNKSGKETALTKVIAALGVVMGIIGTSMALKGTGSH